MDFKRNPINQSLIHKFLFKGEEKQDLCPFKVYAIDIVKSHSYTTESMSKGSYFETLCLGRGAGGRVTNDLPRKLLKKDKQLENIRRAQMNMPLHKGEKTLDQTRIEEQAVNFKMLAAKYQVMVTQSNTQLRVNMPWDKNPDIWFSMEFDIFPTTILTKEGAKMAVIDLKLTADINSTYGEFCWGSPEFLDLTQAYMYSYAVRKLANNMQFNPHLVGILSDTALRIIEQDQIQFYYWVFSYKKIENKLIVVEWDKTREHELEESIRKTVSLIDYYEQLGWPTKPSYKVCKECTVWECKDRNNIQSI